MSIKKIMRHMALTALLLNPSDYQTMDSQFDTIRRQEAAPKEHWLITKFHDLTGNFFRSNPQEPKRIPKSVSPQQAYIPDFFEPETQQRPNPIDPQQKSISLSSAKAKDFKTSKDTRAGSPTEQASRRAAKFNDWIQKPENHTPENIAQIDPAFFKQSQQALRSLTPEAIGMLSGDQLNALLEKQRNSSVDLPSVDLPSVDLSKVTPKTIAQIDPANIAQLSENNLATLTDEQIRALTDAQLTALQPHQLKKFTETQMHAFTDEQFTILVQSQKFQGWTKDQRDIISPEQKQLATKINQAKRQQQGPTQKAIVREIDTPMLTKQNATN